MRIFLPEYYKKDGSLVDLEELTTNQAYFTSVLLVPKDSLITGKSRIIDHWEVYDASVSKETRRRVLLYTELVTPPPLLRNPAIDPQ